MRRYHPFIHTLLIALASLLAAALASLPAQAWKQNILHSFCKGKEQCTAQSPDSQGLIMDSANNIYGVEYYGPDSAGSIFEMRYNSATLSWKYRELYVFISNCNINGCRDGYHPVGRLIMDRTGALYGLTAGYRFDKDRKSGGRGDAFQLTPNKKRTNWKFRILYRFCPSHGCFDGANPSAALTYAGENQGKLYDGVSPLYGVTDQGGTRNLGVAFQLSPRAPNAHWTEEVIYNFCTQGGKKCADGADPLQVRAGARGRLYVATVVGGANNAGAIVQLTNKNDTWNEVTLYNFCSRANCADGKEPVDSLLLDSSETVFGTTEYGGSTNAFCGTYGCGVIYRLVPNGVMSQFDVLHTYCSGKTCSDGVTAEVIARSPSGLLYSTSYQGGKYNGGTVLQLTSQGDTWSAKVVHNFCAKNAKSECSDGGNPYGVITDQSGNVFGTTLFGGASSKGTVFELSP